MKFKKQPFAILAIAGVLAIMLTACGGENKPDATQELSNTQNTQNTTEQQENITTEEDETNTAQADTESEEDKHLTTSVIDVGNFSFELPSNWKAYPQTDIFAERNEDGTYPIDKNYIYISKDAESELELFTKPSISIRRYDIDEELISSKDWYVNVEDIDISIPNAKLIEAYTGDSDIVEGWTYQILTFATNGGQYSVTIPTRANDEETNLSYDNPDIKFVLESLSSVTSPPEDTSETEPVIEDTATQEEVVDVQEVSNVTDTEE